MKTVLKLPLKHAKVILVEEEQAVKKGDPIASYNEESPDVEINISGILKAAPKIIYKFLKKKPGDGIRLHETLALKKSFVSRLEVKSPVEGKIKQVDLIRGSVVISPAKATQSNLKSPVEGHVKSVGKDYVEIEIKGIRIEGKAGQGHDATGELFNIHEGIKSIYEIDDGVADKIVLIKEANGELMAKIDTLEAKGVIAVHVNDNYAFPSVTVTEDGFAKLSHHHGKTAIILPAAAEILITE